MRPYLRVANVYENRIDLSDVLRMNFSPEEFETYELRYGDILLNEGQSLEWVGRPAMYRDELPGACFQNTLVRFRSSPAVIPEYALMVFLHYLRCQRFQKIARWTVNIAHLGASRLAEVEFPLAPLDEQRRIVDALDELLPDLDAGVGALERASKKLAQYREAILKAAVEGDLTAEWRQRHAPSESASSSLESLLSERRRRWTECQTYRSKKGTKRATIKRPAAYRDPLAPDTRDLPSLPGGWSWGTIEQLLSEPITNGISIRGSDQPPGAAALRLNAMTETGFDYSARRYLPLAAEDLEEIWVTAGDFFVSRGNGSKRLVGRGTLAQEPPDPIIFPDTMMRLRLLRAPGLSVWISKIWGSRWVRRQIERAAKTTAGIWKIAQPDLSRIVVPLPSSEEQEEIVEAIEEQLSIVDHLEADLEMKLKSAERLRQSILRHAFTGRLVSQDPTDEPASELLKRIAAERELCLQRTTAVRKVGRPRRAAAPRPTQ